MSVKRKRSRREIMKALLRLKFGSLMDASKQIDIRYAKLSQYLTGFGSLSEKEKTAIRKRLKLSVEQFREMDEV